MIHQCKENIGKKTLNKQHIMAAQEKNYDMFL